MDNFVSGTYGPLWIFRLHVFKKLNDIEYKTEHKTGPTIFVSMSQTTSICYENNVLIVSTSNNHKFKTSQSKSHKVRACVF